MRKNTEKTPMSELLQKLTRSCFADRDALGLGANTGGTVADVAAAGDGRYAGRGRTPATTTISCVSATK